MLEAAERAAAAPPAAAAASAGAASAAVSRPAPTPATAAGGGEDGAHAVVTLLDDELGEGNADARAPPGGTTPSQQTSSGVAPLPVDPTGMLTWMRDGRIAAKRAQLPR